MSVQYADTTSVLKSDTSLQNVPMGTLQIIYAQRVKASGVMGTLSYVIHSRVRSLCLRDLWVREGSPQTASDGPI